MIESLYKLTLFVLILAISLGFFFAVSLFLAKASCSNNDNLCPINSSYYKTEWFACWKTCAPKTPRLNVKTCECSCIETVSL